jgi:arsenite methyltransferase
VSDRSEVQEAVRTRYAAKALQMAPTGVTGRLGLACNLGAADHETRRREWKSIDGAALIDRVESGGTVTSTYRASPETRGELERLVVAERGCCGTAGWSLHDDGDKLRVTVGASSGACCGDDGCGTAYSSEELASVGIDPTASLGCGNPMLLADLRPGERVLDLGSGAGLDVLLSARRVAPGGHAYGVDMTDEMLAVARGNQQKAAVTNATFLKGTIEEIPLPDASVDVVISNCVINLAADKRAVLREAYRVLGPGGRFAVADMVALAELPAEVKRSLDQWAGCVAGTISIEEYTDALREVGFRDVDVEVTRETRLEGVDGAIASAYIRARKEPPQPAN